MAYDASRNVILYHALKECLKRMYQEKKFDHYQYKFNPLIFRGSDVALEDSFADSGGHFEKNEVEENGDIGDMYKHFVITYTVFHRGVFRSRPLRFARSKPYWRVKTKIQLNKEAANNYELNVRTFVLGSDTEFVFPLKTYCGSLKNIVVGDSTNRKIIMSNEDILQKFEEEFMEVPPCVLQQRNFETIQGEERLLIEFIPASVVEFQNMYNGIGRYYDEEFEKRKVLIHRFREFPIELLREYIFFKGQDPNINEISHLQLIDS